MPLISHNGLHFRAKRDNIKTLTAVMHGRFLAYRPAWVPNTSVGLNKVKWASEWGKNAAFMQCNWELTLIKIAVSSCKGFVFVFQKVRHNTSQSLRALQLSDTYK